MSDVAYHLACECVCSDGSGRPCQSDVGHFRNGTFVPNAKYYKAIEAAKEYDRKRIAAGEDLRIGG